MTRVTQKQTENTNSADHHFSGYVTAAPFRSRTSLISVVSVMVFNRQSTKQTKLSLYKYILLNFSLADRTSNWEEIKVHLEVSTVQVKLKCNNL